MYVLCLKMKLQYYDTFLIWTGASFASTAKMSSSTFASHQLASALLDHSMSSSGSGSGGNLEPLPPRRMTTAGPTFRLSSSSPYENVNLNFSANLGEGFPVFPWHTWPVSCQDIVLWAFPVTFRIWACQDSNVLLDNNRSNCTVLVYVTPDIEHTEWTNRMWMKWGQVKVNRSPTPRASPRPCQRQFLPSHPFLQSDFLSSWGLVWSRSSTLLPRVPRPPCAPHQGHIPSSEMLLYYSVQSL